MAITARSILRCTAAVLFIALGAAIFGTGIQGMNALMTLASLQDIFTQVAPPMNGVIFGQYANLGQYSQAGDVPYLRADVDQGSIWAMVSVGGVAIVTGFIVLMDGIFVHPTSRGFGLSYKAWMGTAGVVASACGLLAFLYSFISTYISRNHVVFNALQQQFLAFRTEAITFTPNGYVNQEEYSCFCAGYDKPGANTTARGTAQWEPFVTSCHMFMAARWLTIPFLLVSLWLAAQEIFFVTKSYPEFSSGETSSDDLGKEKKTESAPVAAEQPGQAV